MALQSLEELCEFITDGTHQTPEYCEDGGVLFLSSKDVTSRKIDWDNAKRIPESLHEKLYSRLSPKRDDILLAKNGTTGVAAIVDRDDIFDVYVSLAVLRPKKTIYPPYLLHAINSASVKRQFDAGIKGIGVPNLHLSVIRKAVVNITKLEEQHEITNHLEAVSRIIEFRKKQLETFDTLIKARFVEMFGDPLHSEKGWPSLVLCEACSSIFGGGTPSKSHPEYFTGTIPWVSPKDMKSDVIRDSIDHITEEAISNSTTNLVPINSVLMVIRSGILKHSLPVAINSVPVTINQDMKAFIPGKLILTEYLMYYFKAIESDAVRYALSHPEMSQEECAKNLGIGHSTLNRWIKKYRENNGEIPSPGSGNYMSDEQKEIARLKRELRDTQNALDVLKKAISILGKD